MSDSQQATYRHPIFGTRPLNADEALRYLRRVTNAYREAIDLILEYDEEHPELWATCSEHPDGSCGQRDVPSFLSHACITTCDVQDAQTFLAAWDRAVSAAGQHNTQP